MMYLRWLLLVTVLLLAGCAGESNAQPTSVWGGPYSPRSWGGQDLPEFKNGAKWVEDELQMNFLPLDYGVTVSIEVDAGTCTYDPVCTFHPDPEKNAQGDKNPPAEGSFTFEQDGWGLLSIPPGVEDCNFVCQP